MERGISRKGHSVDIFGFSIPDLHVEAEAHHLGDALVLLIAAVLIAPLLRRLRFSMILGYLVAGAAIGPAGLGLIEEFEEVKALAEFGVVFLLFTIGLELSFERLKALSKYVLGLGSLQVVVTSFALGLAVWLALGIDPLAALVVGASVALSSTAFVMQLLIDKGELATQHGRAAFGTLLMQDLAVVPLLVLVPLLGQSGSALAIAMGVVSLKALIALVVIVIIGRLLLRPIYQLIAATHSAELFTAMTLLVVLGTAWATMVSGLSMALGAFMAGLLVSESEYRHQVEADIRPFKGILLGLFFMSIGMAIDLGRLIGEPIFVLMLVLGLMAMKAAIAGGLALMVGLPRLSAVRVGALLCQGGEFAFVILAIAVANDIVPYATVQLSVLVVGLSMALTPLVTSASGWIASKGEAGAVPGPEQASGEAEREGHVIVCGFGRVGRIVTRLLAEQGLEVIALDLDPRNVAEGRRRQLPIYYGDAGRAEVLRMVGADRAFAIVVTVDHHVPAERIVRASCRNFPETKIFARAHDVAEGQELESLGVMISVPETLEASLQLGAAVLRVRGTPLEEVEGIVTDMRHDLGVGLVNPELEGDPALELVSTDGLPGEFDTGDPDEQARERDQAARVEEAALIRLSESLEERPSDMEPAAEDQKADGTKRRKWLVV